MTVDCQWIRKNLEALFCGTLNPEENRIARAHIENCASCEKEIAALNAIDPIVQRYFQGELNRAVGVSAARSRMLWKRRLALTSGGVLAASVLLAVALRTPPQAPVPPLPSIAQEVTGQEAPDAAPPAKTDDSSADRAKPVDRSTGDRTPGAGARSKTDNAAPEFLVTDPAGYSRTLADYRGHMLLIGLLNSRQADSSSNLERLYETFGSSAKIRFLAVPENHQARPANTRFPIAYNQGSKLFGALPGDFVLLDETGSVRLRGSLVKDIESLKKALGN
jgi:hypothetical protein